MSPQFSKAERRIVQDLREHGQDHVLRWVDELALPARRRFMAQLAALDFGLLEEFQRLIETPPTDLSFADVIPAPIQRLPLSAAQQEAEEQVAQTGRAALEANRVAVLTVAGGQGTRLGYDHPKGMYPITPIRGKSLFQLFAERILAARERYRCALPWLIMTGLTNDEEARAFFWDHSYFGLGADTVHFFVQQDNPILDQDGRLLLADKGCLAAGPDGHGGTFAALAQSGMLDLLRNGGWDLISYFQVDNALVPVADRRFIGHHLRQEADFSCKVVAKRDPQEGLGLAVLKGDRPAVIEYVDVPKDVAAARLPSGKLRYRHGSIAVHIISVPFAERVANQKDGLPWHVARKKYEVLDVEGRGAPAVSVSCHKFERFIFDALAFADRCAFVEVRRDHEFAPVKNAEGEDSPASARMLLQRRWLQWLQEAGAAVRVPRDLSSPLVEVSPLFASSVEDVKERIRPGWKPSFPLVLER
jgi:UDP-N-acetylglucosamine/UDP-N-acetylgalactosamine diphosphorylase